MNDLNMLLSCFGTKMSGPIFLDIWAHSFSTNTCVRDDVFVHSQYLLETQLQSRRRRRAVSGPGLLLPIIHKYSDSERSLLDCHQVCFAEYLTKLPHTGLVLARCWLTVPEYTGLPNKACPRLRDLATAPARGITQPRTNLIREPCINLLY